MDDKTSISDLLLSCGTFLKELVFNDEELEQKVLFLADQLELSTIASKRRQYSPNLLSACVLWETTSSALYKKMASDSFLTLPSVRWLKQLTSALTVEIWPTNDELIF